MADDFFDLPEKLQDGMGAWLAAHAAVVAAFGDANPVRVLSAQDDQRKIPYLQTGEDAFYPQGSQDSPLCLVRSRVHVWTRETGFVLCKKVGGAVARALSITSAAGVNNGMQVDGYSVVSGFLLMARYEHSPGENTRHGILDFEMRFVPAA